MNRAKESAHRNISSIAGMLMKSVLVCLLLTPVKLLAAQIDVLVLYDDAVNAFENNSPNTLIRSYIDATNTFYENSGVDIELRLVDTQNYDEGFSAIGASAILELITASDQVRQWRDAARADLVVQFTRLEGEADDDATSILCGLAWLGQGNRFDAENTAFSVVRPACGPITLAHEIGHNMGLNHSRMDGDVGGVVEYGLGYGTFGGFRTIMTTGGTFGFAEPVARFSDPDMLCFGQPCGVPIGEPNSANAVAALNAIKDQVAAYRNATGAPISSGAGGSSSGSLPTIPGSSSGAPRSSGSGAFSIWQTVIWSLMLFGVAVSRLQSSAARRD